ncbi:hypothetical protein C0W59_11800 [Photobacterium kishitanii]|uniref:hypothetical protein n=1 Tax=Photobacterium kishitanii TaxID=318456 RepID=UPI000D15D113|nr:hypothetical protein [Photobacterium kishitanii]PSV15156.1 hypothetical protein C0W59_11800 [Photobacterium kishitanii]
MAIPWLIGAAVAAGVTAFAKNAYDEEQREEAERRARREAREERERLQAEAKKKRQEAQRKEKAQIKAQKIRVLQSFAQQKSKGIIEKYGITEMSYKDLSALAISNSSLMEKKTKTAFYSSSKATQLQNEVMSLDAQLADIEKLYNQLSEIK